MAWRNPKPGAAMRPRSEGERGAALLTVLLLVAMVGALAAVTLEKLNLSMRLAANTADLAQARAYASAAETTALIRINALIGEGAARVSLDGGWSDRPFALPVPQGIATVRVRDGGNCFNLNSLVSDGDKGIHIANPAAVAQFARLMTQLGLPSAASIAAAAADWIDSDTMALPNGAEDPVYAGRTPGYRTANTLMRDPSELRAVAGVTPDIYRRLRPFVCTLPTTRAAKINVNTLQPEQGALISMQVADLLSPDRVGQVILSRPSGGWASGTDFWEKTSLSVLGPAPDNLNIAVKTRWFALRSDVTVGRSSFVETGLIDAGRPPARLVSRQWGEES